jgi:hypothetical protein
LPKSGTAALDLENEKRAPKESSNGMPRMINSTFKQWLNVE